MAELFLIPRNISHLSFSFICVKVQVCEPKCKPQTCNPKLEIAQDFTRECVMSTKVFNSEPSCVYILSILQYVWCSGSSFSMTDVQRGPSCVGAQTTCAERVT